MDIFFEIHRDLPREGPGSDASTAQAISLIPHLPRNPQILDIGCGPGMQTLVLARLTDGRVTAVDLHQPYLDELARRAQQQGLSHQITTQVGSMMALEFDEERFDLIWSEGAIYIMGFREGLESWRHFLKPGGALAVTEVSWLAENPPEQLIEFWKNAYPAIKPVEENIQIIQESGYTATASFALPESDWWDEYYRPIEQRIADLRNKYERDPEALAALDGEQMEIDLYRQYSGWYGYVFYIMQKPG